MSLKDLNVNKLIGREAILQGDWTVTTKDGQTHTVWAGMKSGLVGAKIVVKIDDKPRLEKRKHIIAGQMAEFEIGEDIFVVRHSGYGLLGQLSLVQNGRELDKQVQASHQSDGTDETPTEDDNWETWIEEAERFSEPLGDEVRVIDNSRSGSVTERKIVVSRQWSQSVALDTEKATEIGGDINAKLPLGLGFSASAKQSIKRRYAISEESSRTYSEEVTINVQPWTRSTVTFSWRQVWQKGIVVGRSDNGFEVRAPFEVKLHPTFDQAQEDERFGDPSENK